MSTKLKGSVSKWSKEADYRIKNRICLRYSSQIARRVLAQLEECNMSKGELAKKLGVPASAITKIVQGRTNLTLKTISRLSKVFDTEFISFPEYKYSKK